MKRIIASDPGILGGFALHDNTVIPTPLIKTETKPAIRILCKDSKGKKIIYKTGPLKGTPKYKIKTQAKHRLDLDVHAIYKLLKQHDVFIYEGLGSTMGNSARSSRTTSINYGKVLALAELANTEIIIVTPAKWKSDLKLTREKIDSVLLAEKLSGQSFRTERGALLDGQSESFLLKYWYEQKDK